MPHQIRVTNPTQQRARQAGTTQKQLKPVNFPADIVYFPGTHDNTAVEIYFGIPLGMIFWQPQMFTFSGSVEYSTVVLNKDSVRVFSHADTVALRLQIIDMEHIYNDVYTIREQMELKPGAYMVEIKMADKKAGYYGFLRQGVTVDSFAGESLNISDLIVAYNIAMAEPQWQPTRETVRLYHHPGHMFVKNKPIFVYFELQNLLLNPQTKKTAYKVEYAVNPLKKGTPQNVILNSFMKYTPWENIKSEQVWTTLEGESLQRSDIQLIRIEHPFVEPGEYLLTVKVTDTISGKTVQRSVPIWIFERKY
jgi:hypothetical protein